MDISSNSPQLMVQQAMQQRNANTQLDAQVSLVKKARDAEASAVTQLLDSVPQATEGNKGQNINLQL